MRRSSVVVAVSVLALSLTLPAGAITDGEPDGNGHPMVGAIVAEFDGVKDWFCSGTLIARDVVLTAGHCTDFLASQGIDDVWVTFDPVFSNRSKLLHGSYVTHPGYNGNTLANDVAAIVLDKAVRRVTPATLPDEGLLDDMKADGSLARPHFGGLPALAGSTR